LETSLYPWLRSGALSTSAASLRDSYAGRGIVMTTGAKHFLYAHHSIRALRMVGSTLPIEVHYLGRADLSPAHIAALTALPNVTVQDLSLAFALSPERFHSWAIKPFAMLASSFREMIFVDADALFFQPPETLFDSEAYKRTGTAFFMDRTMLRGTQRIREFALNAIGVPSEYAWCHGRVFRNLTLHEGESGVVVYDKVVNFHALLLAAKMNLEPWKGFMYRHVHG
ncbi:alpha-mannosyltransferase, partial [Blyttiomyces helicus]